MKMSAARTAGHRRPHEGALAAVALIVHRRRRDVSANPTLRRPIGNPSRRHRRG
jgi:hypothetical protein